MKLRNMTSLYLVEEDRILCLYRIGSRVVSNKYVGSAGGHFEPAELNDPRACVLREMREELGLSESDVDGLKLRYITHRLMEGEIRQNYYFFAHLDDPDKIAQSNEGNLEWVPFAKASDLNMPHSAWFVVDHFLKEGKDNNLLYGGITTENSVEFTVLSEF